MRLYLTSMAFILPGICLARPIGAGLNRFGIEKIPGRGIGSDLLRRWIRDEEKTGLAPPIDLGEKMT